MILVLFEMYFLKWCYELLLINSTVAGGFWQGQMYPNRGKSSSSCMFFKYLWPLQEQNINIAHLQLYYLKINCVNLDVSIFIS